MATKKKTTARRAPRSTTPRTFGDGQPAVPVAEGENGVAAPAAVQTTPVPVRGTSLDARRRAAVRSEARPQLPLSEEYAYVPGDLKRLGIMALSMIGVMVVLGLIVH